MDPLSFCPLPSFLSPRVALPTVGIRGRLLMLVLGMGLPFLAYIALSTTRQAEREEERLRERVRAAAALAASRLDAHVSHIAGFLGTLGVALPLSDHDRAANDARLRSLAPGLPAHVSSLELWSHDGTNLGSSASDDARPKTLFDTSEAAVGDGGLEVHAPISRNGTWVAVFALRLQRESGARLIATATVDLLTLPRLLDPDGQLRDGAVAAVVDADNRVLARSLDAHRYVGTTSPFDRVQMLRRLAAGEGDTRSPGLDGRERILGFARTRELPWLVYAGTPVDVAMAPGARERARGVALGIALLVLGFAYAAWLAGAIARPLRQLARDAKAIGEGEAHRRTTVRHGGEVGLLATMLNRMAQALQDRMAQMRRQEERLTLALEASAQSMFDMDLQANRLHLDTRTASLLGEAARVTDLDPATLQHRVHPEDLPALKAAVSALATRDLYAVEYRGRHVEGHWVWIRSRGRVVERDEDGRPLRLIGADADISEAKAAEAALRERAERDVLTGLPNRALFRDRLEHAIDRARRTGRAMALLYLDVDRFKQVNDTLGHAAGDALLQETASRLERTVRSSDTVARMGGDEFTLILESLVDPADAAMRLPIGLPSGPVTVSISVGIAILAADDTAQGLLARADEALYDAKHGGRDRYALGASPKATPATGSTRPGPFTSSVRR